MLDISTLRILGMLLGAVVLVAVSRGLRSYERNRANTFFLVLFGFALILVSAFPRVATLPSDIISLSNVRGGRIITLLLVSNVFLWFLVLYERGKSANSRDQFETLTRRMAVRTFLGEGRHLSSDVILILMPALNEAENLNSVLPRIPERISGAPVAVLVINDGSTDATETVARRHGALVANQLVNRGGGAALRAGYDIAKAFHASVIVTMDTDGQHDPAEIATLVQPILEGELDFVIGSRMLGSYDKYSMARIIGVVFFSKLINLLMGIRITDCSSGFRAISSSLLKEVELRQDQFHTTEMIIEAAKRNYRIGERPVHIARRLSGKSKKGTDVMYGIFFLRAILKTWWR